MSQYLFQKKTSDEIMVENAIGYQNYDEIRSMINHNDNSDLYLDMLIDYAVKNNNTNILDYLLKNCKNYTRCTQEIFDCAIEQGRLYLVKLSGKEIKSNDSYALEIVCERGYLDILQYIIETNPKIMFKQNYYVCLASQNGHMHIIKFLIENGANFKAKNHRALCLAQQNGHKDIVDYLLTIGSKFPTPKKIMQQI